MRPEDDLQADHLPGVHAIAHLATPVGFHFTDPEPILEAAVQGTTGILESATKESSVKSIVLMSSVAAVLSEKPAGYNFTEKDWNLDAMPAIEQLGKSSPGPLIYTASKVASEQAFWKFREEKKPSFSMTAINPVYVSNLDSTPSTSLLTIKTASSWVLQPPSSPLTSSA